MKWLALCMLAVIGLAPVFTTESLSLADVALAVGMAGPLAFALGRRAVP
jgi:hypothetical protein